MKIDDIPQGYWFECRDEFPNVGVYVGKTRVYDFITGFARDEDGSFWVKSYTPAEYSRKHGNGNIDPSSVPFMDRLKFLLGGKSLQADPVTNHTGINPFAYGHDPHERVSMIPDAELGHFVDGKFVNLEHYLFEPCHAS